MRGAGVDDRDKPGHDVEPCLFDGTTQCPAMWRPIVVRSAPAAGVS